jgi:hypothetical protein
MKSEYFKFKKWTTLLNFLMMTLFGWMAILLFPSAIEDIRKLSEIKDLGLPVFVVALIWLAVCDFGYNFLLSFSSGNALELHEDHIVICTIFGLKKIPRQAVNGCKNPVHRWTKGPKSGAVIVIVTPEYKVIGSFGFKTNPQFHGASVIGEDEQSIVKKIRAWRRNT